MSNLNEYIQQLEESGAVEKGRIQKLAAAALKLEVGEKAMHPLEAFKELIGIKKPIGARALEYVQEGFQQAKPRVGFALAAAGAALGAAGTVKLINKVKFHSALNELKRDPEVQADPAKAESIAHMVYRWAPSIASDPQVLKGTVKNLMRFPDTYLTYDVAAKLSDAEKRYAATHGLYAALKERVL